LLSVNVDAASDITEVFSVGMLMIPIASLHGINLFKSYGIVDENLVGIIGDDVLNSILLEGSFLTVLLHLPYLFT
jgi:hypothetical protein